MRNRTGTTRVLLTAGQIAVVLLSAGLVARSAGRRTHLEPPPNPPRNQDPPPLISVAAYSSNLSTPGLQRLPAQRLAGLLGVLTGLLGLTSLIGGTTLSLMGSSKSGQPDTFQAATLSLSAAAPTGTCTVTGLTPGAAATTCALEVTYAGSASALTGLDVFIATKPGTIASAENLYNPSGADSPATVTVTDNQSPAVNYVLPTSALGTCPTLGPLDGVDYASYAACYSASDLLVSKGGLTNGGSVTFTTSIQVPTANASAYQGGSVVVVISPHVVQAANNGSTSTCTAGAVCPTVSNWS